MNLAEHKLDVGRTIHMYIDNELYDKGVIKRVEDATETRGARLEIITEKSGEKNPIWLGYIEHNPHIDPGWRYLQPDPFESMRLTYSTRGPVYELRPQV